jgi:PAS domain S-box-containing protein
MNVTFNRYSHLLSRNYSKRPVQAGTRGIARRLILAIVLFSSLITLVVTAIQLYRDYNRDLQLIDSQLNQIQNVHIRSIAGSLWLLDEKSVQIQVDGILQLPDILYLEVSDGKRIWTSSGDKPVEKMILREYPLTYLHLGQELHIGSMIAVATLERVYQRLIDKTVEILISNAIRTFLVAGFMLLVFHFLVTRHLIDIASFVRSQDLEQKGEPLRLDRKTSKVRTDELDLMVDELNLMRDSLRQSFATLKQSEEKYRELYDTMAQGVVHQDAEGKIVSANKAATDILGLSFEQMQGKTSLDPDWKTIHEDGREFSGADHPAIKALRSSKSIDGVVMGVYHPKEQRHRWIIISSKLRFLPGKSKAYEVFTTFTDISERKWASEERETLISELEIKNRELERFAYAISHELKTPLVTIAGFSGILAEDIEKGRKEKLCSHLQHITSAVTIMSVMLDELLDLSRVGRVNNTHETVSMRELIEDVVNMLEYQAAERGVKVEISPGMPDVIGDRIRLREVLQNLTENAIKFSAGFPDARVKVSWHDADPDPVFYVQDNGKGIDPGYHEKIFNLFERLDPYVEGTGIGLTLVQRIIEEHGGKIWVESEGSGTGSTFYFTIPRQPKD